MIEMELHFIASLLISALQVFVFAKGMKYKCGQILKCLSIEYIFSSINRSSCKGQENQRVQRKKSLRNKQSP
jgi:hypothetical protein